MKYTSNEINPIEFIRIKEELSQKAFSQKLGFKNKEQYAYHMNNFTPVILDKIKDAYDKDISIKVIKHLKSKIGKLGKNNIKLKAINKKLYQSNGNCTPSLEEMMENM